jgi:hypothetical protein
MNTYATEAEAQAKADKLNAMYPKPVYFVMLTKVTNRYLVTTRKPGAGA